MRLGHCKGGGFAAALGTTVPHPQAPSCVRCCQCALDAPSHRLCGLKVHALHAGSKLDNKAGAAECASDLMGILGYSMKGSVSFFGALCVSKEVDPPLKLRCSFSAVPGQDPIQAELVRGSC